MLIYLILILGAISFSSSVLLEKIVLKSKSIKVQTYLVGIFLSTILVMLPFIFFFGKVDSQAFAVKNLIILFLIILFSILANLFNFYALKWEKVTMLEPVLLLEPLFIILLAFLFFKTERNYFLLIPGLISVNFDCFTFKKTSPLIQQISYRWNLEQFVLCNRAFNK